MSADVTFDACAVRSPTVCATSVVLRSALTACEISTPPRYIVSISGSRTANSTAETPRWSAAKRRSDAGVTDWMLSRVMAEASVVRLVAERGGGDQQPVVAPHVR